MFLGQCTHKLYTNVILSYINFYYTEIKTVYSSCLLLLIVLCVNGISSLNLKYMSTITKFLLEIGGSSKEVNDEKINKYSLFFRNDRFMLLCK